MNAIRMQCLELAVRSGARDPLETAERFLRFVGDHVEADEITSSTLSTKKAGFLRFRPLAVKTIERIAQKHGITASAIMGGRRSAPIVAARNEAISAVNDEFPQMSLPEIGRLFGKDHTTILHSLRRTGNWKPKIVAA